MKHNIYEFSLFLNILCFVSKGSLNIPEYRCLLIGCVQYLYTIEHAVENIAYHRFQLRFPANETFREKMRRNSKIFVRIPQL